MSSRTDATGEPTGPRQQVADAGYPDGSEIYQIPIDGLVDGDSPRLNGESEDHARMLAHSETDLPPILVHRGTMRVIDGMHRLRAARLRGERTIRVRFFDGDEAEAFLVAVRSNVAHGLPLTLSDREAAAARILTTHGQHSDRAIAAIAGLSAGTVSEIRRRTRPDADQMTARIGRDGRVRPVSSAEGRRMASQAIARRPDASMREIARSVGLSPTTVRDVRERMRRGEDPIPTGQRAEVAEPVEPVEPTPGWPARRDSGGRGTAVDTDEGDTGPTRAELMETLTRDPSLRLSDAGRRLLRVLYTRSGGPPDSSILDLVPPHCTYTVAALSRACAREWLRFADDIERRLRSRNCPTVDSEQLAHG